MHVCVCVWLDLGQLLPVQIGLTIDHKITTSQCLSKVLRVKLVNFNGFPHWVTCTFFIKSNRPITHQGQNLVWEPLGVLN